MNIDIVYLWVDGNDPVWRAKKEAFERGVPHSASEALAEARFADNDELKYSLRSVERFAPWIHHIYIVTDKQVPAWIDLTNKRISIVDHTEIMPREALPSFSSPAIEWCIDNIPGLSEHFLLANDDTFIGREVGPDFFFNPKGEPIVRLKKWASSKRRISLYLKTVERAQHAIERELGKRTKYIPHHNIDAYRKSDFKACKKIFRQEVNETIHRHIRSEKDFQRVAISYYALAIGAGELRLMGRYNRSTSLTGKLACLLRNRFTYDSRRIAITVPDIRAVLDKYSPTLYCLNDGEEANEECRERVRRFLEEEFPVKSSFEL